MSTMLPIGSPFTNGLDGGVSQWWPHYSQPSSFSGDAAQSKGSEGVYRRFQRLAPALRRRLRHLHGVGPYDKPRELLKTDQPPAAIPNFMNDAATNAARHSTQGWNDDTTIRSEGANGADMIINHVDHRVEPQQGPTYPPIMTGAYDALVGRGGFWSMERGEFSGQSSHPEKGWYEAYASPGPDLGKETIPWTDVPSSDAGRPIVGVYLGETAWELSQNMAKRSEGHQCDLLSNISTSHHQYNVGLAEVSFHETVGTMSSGYGNYQAADLLDSHENASFNMYNAYPNTDQAVDLAPGSSAALYGSVQTESWNLNNLPQAAGPTMFGLDAPIANFPSERAEYPLGNAVDTQHPYSVPFDGPSITAGYYDGALEDVDVPTNVGASATPYFPDQGHLHQQHLRYHDQGNFVGTSSASSYPEQYSLGNDRQDAHHGWMHQESAVAGGSADVVKPYVVKVTYEEPVYGVSSAIHESVSTVDVPYMPASFLPSSTAGAAVQSSLSSCQTASMGPPYVRREVSQAYEQTPGHCQVLGVDQSLGGAAAAGAHVSRDVCHHSHWHGHAAEVGGTHAITVPVLENPTFVQKNQNDAHHHRDQPQLSPNTDSPPTSSSSSSTSSSSSSPLGSSSDMQFSQKLTPEEAKERAPQMQEVIEDMIGGDFF